MEGKTSHTKYTVPLAVLAILSLVSTSSVLANVPVLYLAYAQSSNSANAGNANAPLPETKATKTSGNIIPNQWIVTLKDNATINSQTSNSSIKALSDEAENTGVQVVASLPDAGALIVTTPEGKVSALAD